MRIHVPVLFDWEHWRRTPRPISACHRAHSTQRILAPKTHCFTTAIASPWRKTFAPWLMFQRQAREQAEEAQCTRRNRCVHCGSGIRWPSVECSAPQLGLTMSARLDLCATNAVDPALHIAALAPSGRCATAASATSQCFVVAAVL